jgi:hypothetical protein
MRVFPRATTPVAAVVFPARTWSAPAISRVYCAHGDLTAGASVRLIARAKAFARTGVPSLKRKLRRRVNVNVLLSCETRGGRAATSGCSRDPSWLGE